MGVESDFKANWAAAPPWRRGFAVITVTSVVVLAILGLGWGILAVAGGGDDPHSRHVTATDYGDAWPLTVEEDTLRCVNPGIDGVVFEHGSSRYAVNGMGSTTVGGGGEDIRPI